MSRRRLQRPESISIYHEIRSIFDLIDTDRDNLIMIDEFKAFLQQFDLVDADDKIKNFLVKHPESLTLNDFSELYCHAMDIDLKEEIYKLKTTVANKKKPPPPPPRKKRQTVRIEEPIQSQKVEEKVEVPQKTPEIIEEETDSETDSESDDEEEKTKSQPIKIVEKVEEPEIILGSVPTKIEQTEKKKPPLPQARKPIVNTTQENNNNSLEKPTETKKVAPPPPSRAKKPSLIIQQPNQVVAEGSTVDKVTPDIPTVDIQKKAPPPAPSKAKKPSLIGKPTEEVTPTKEVNQEINPAVDTSKKAPPPTPSKAKKPSLIGKPVEVNPIQTDPESTGPKPSEEVDDQQKLIIANWRTYMDKKRGREYYYNKITKETTWKNPFETMNTPTKELVKETIKELVKETKQEIPVDKILKQPPPAVPSKEKKPSLIGRVDDEMVKPIDQSPSVLNNETNINKIEKKAPPPAPSKAKKPSLISQQPVISLEKSNVEIFTTPELQINASEKVSDEMKPSLIGKPVNTKVSNLDATKKAPPPTPSKQKKPSLIGKPVDLPKDEVIETNTEDEIPKKDAPPKQKKSSVIKIEEETITQTPIQEIQVEKIDQKVLPKESKVVEEIRTANQEIEQPVKKTPPIAPSKENKPKRHQQEEEKEVEHVEQVGDEKETEVHVSADDSNEDLLKKPDQQDRNSRHSGKYVRSEHKMQNRKAMSFRPANETVEEYQEEEEEVKVFIPPSPPPPPPPSKEIKDIPKIKIHAPKEMKKIQKPWSKKKSGAIHFLAEFGQFFKKEIDRRHEKELEEHANSASIFGIGEATNHLFEFNEEEQKEKKVKKKKGYLIMKQSFTGKWKKVYCILRKDKLVYYKSKKSYQDGESQISSIFLLSATIDFEDHKNHEFCFNLVSRGDDHIFECSSEEERKDWVFDIRDVINDRWNTPETNPDNTKKIGKIKNPNYIENANIEYIRHY